ncbi:MAG: CHAT domain-containing protein [Bryobacteraceae bacterium]|nr:CHAT domain-containing protein [Bryobacteraceae bacterium]MDW8377692.1 CHAT domain-containing protein [Bryobacterales bacterium]
MRFFASFGRFFLTIALLLVLNGRTAPGTASGGAQLWAAFTDSEQRLLRQLLQAAPAGLTNDELARAEQARSQAEKDKHFILGVALDYVLCQAYFARQQLDRALACAIRGRDRSRFLNHPTLGALCHFGIARIHQLAGNYGQAEQAAVAALMEASRARYRSLEIRSVLAGIQSRLQKLTQSELQFRLALEEARQLKDERSAASIEELYGLNLLRWNRAQEGHQAIERSWRIRQRVAPRELPFSYRSLARSALARGHYQESVAWADRALQTPTPGLSANLILYDKALALEKLGREDKALEALRQAAEATERLRLFFPSSDAIQTGMERQVQNIFSKYADLACRAALQRNDPALVREAFEAAQQNRAWSLRMRVALGADWRQRLPAEYWVKLNELRQLELRQTNSERLRALHSELSDLETLAGLGPPRGSLQPSMCQQRLEPGEALIAFHFGEQLAVRWRVTRSDIRMDRLDSPEKILELVQQFHRSPDEESLARLLYLQLFGDILDPQRDRSLIVVPDQLLFLAPLAALRIPGQQGHPYLAELYPLWLTPAANFVAPLSAQGQSRERGILAIGDPVSNRADPRWAGKEFWWSGRKSLIELPRLVGSRQEIERCARDWEPRRLLTGAEISEENLRQALQLRPQVLHFATHVFQPPQAEASPVLLLGLSAQAEPVVLDVLSITGLPLSPPLVTLSGCGSGRGSLAPGTGLLGLTRAWLMAGARAVVASLWPVVDDSGDLFEEYYRSLQSSKDQITARNVAQALQKAQIAMIRRGGWRAQPSYWGAYFVIGAL